MTTRPQDELDALKAALRAAPAPDARAKADAITQAMKNFDSAQGPRAPLRPTPDRPERAGFVNGVRKMLKSLATPGGLAATTSVAALAVAIAVTLPAQRPGAPVRTEAAPALPETTGVANPVPVAPPAELRQSDEGDALARGAEPRGAEAETGAVAEIAPAAPLPMAKSVPLDEAALGAQVGDAVAPQAESLIAPLPTESTETFASAPANPVKVTAEEPVSTFSIDVDTASYAVVRNSLNAGQMPPAEAVRIEEMVNYFPYSYPAPAADEAPFRPTVTVMPTPWNPGTQLVHIGLQGRMPAIADRPPLNLVFLIDTSGSMDEPDKLPLLKQSFRLMLGELRPEDQVAIVAYAGSAGEVLAPTPARDRAAILDALDRLAAGGSTAGAEGLALAYRIAEGMGGEGEVNRVILATDGDFNVGVSDPAGLEAYVARKRQSGVYLSVLGFGRGNLDDAVMQTLAQNGNGQAAYIDTLQEARKVLVDQLTGALFPIAEDVKIQVEWNPAAVAEYRLIGYETRALRREDFNNDRIDAGEIGAGHSVTAIYEVTAPGSEALRNDPLRYGAATAAGDADELGFLRLRYKEPGAETSRLIETPIAAGTGAAAADARFAVAMAGFGQLLTGATYLGDWGWDQAIALALEARADDRFGYRIEAVNLMRMAQSLDAQ